MTFLISSILSAAMTIYLGWNIHDRLMVTQKYDKRRLTMAVVVPLGFICFLSLTVYLGPIIGKLI